MEYPHRWRHLERITERSGPFANERFKPSSELFGSVQEYVKVLVIGAGGLGCELLKNLALMGFKHIEVIDMDIIEVSNLNRQFLFRASDVGKSKAEVAAAAINKRIEGCEVVPHFKMIQDFDEDFYTEFHIIACGLDSVVARRWINRMLVDIHVEKKSVDDEAVFPMVDGGTEGFKGNVRLIIPKETACIDCTLDLYPPQVTFPLCTIAQTPRLPEHCIEYVKVVLWDKEKKDIPLDGDDPNHINWIYEKALERAAEFNIQGVTYRLTQGVVKNIIPAVASTNAVIAAAIATEVFKLATGAYTTIKNYMVFNDIDGIYTYTFEASVKEKCLGCSEHTRTLTFLESDKLQTLIDYLVEAPELQLRTPGLTMTVGGRNQTLYMRTVSSIEEATRPNLGKTLRDLGIVDGQEINVADATSPSTLIFKLHLVSTMES